MDLAELVQNLDKEFSIAENKEDLVKWAVTEENRKYVYSDFLSQKTGLMIKGSDNIKKVFTTVFITDHIIEKLSNEHGCLILTHHQFDYYEDARGLQAVRSEILQKLFDRGTSIYVAHAPLDTHPKYGTSIVLAKINGIAVDIRFFDYFGAPAAVIGHVARQDFVSFTEKIKKTLQRPYLTIEKHVPYIKNVAVVAGGGDMPEILQQAHDYNCDTLLTGTVEHRWANLHVQQSNREFHELNRNLRLNLVGGTHFGTERPAMIHITELFKKFGIPCEYCEDEELLHAM